MTKTYTNKLSSDLQVLNLAVVINNKVSYSNLYGVYSKDFDTVVSDCAKGYKVMENERFIRIAEQLGKLNNLNLKEVYSISLGGKQVAKFKGDKYDLGDINFSFNYYLIISSDRKFAPTILTEVILNNDSSFILNKTTTKEYKLIYKTDEYIINELNSMLIQNVDDSYDNITSLFRLKINKDTEFIHDFIRDIYNPTNASNIGLSIQTEISNTFNQHYTNNKVMTLLYSIGKHYYDKFEDERDLYPYLLGASFEKVRGIINSIKKIGNAF